MEFSRIMSIYCNCKLYFRNEKILKSFKIKKLKSIEKGKKKTGKKSSSLSSLFSSLFSHHNQRFFCCHFYRKVYVCLLCWFFSTFSWFRLDVINFQLFSHFIFQTQTYFFLSFFLHFCCSSNNSVQPNLRKVRNTRWYCLKFWKYFFLMFFWWNLQPRNLLENETNKFWR